jgi:hypothetical protein
MNPNTQKITRAVYNDNKTHISLQYTWLQRHVQQRARETSRRQAILALPLFNGSVAGARAQLEAGWWRRDWGSGSCGEGDRDNEGRAHYLRLRQQAMNMHMQPGGGGRGAINRIQQQLV